jgi:hypothetical protein
MKSQEAAWPSGVRQQSERAWVRIPPLSKAPCFRNGPGFLKEQDSLGLGKNLQDEDQAVTQNTYFESRTKSAVKLMSPMGSRKTVFAKQELEARSRMDSGQ